MKNSFYEKKKRNKNNKPKKNPNQNKTKTTNKTVCHASVWCYTIVSSYNNIWYCDSCI